MGRRVALYAVKWPDGKIDRVELDESGTVNYASGKCRERIFSQWTVAKALLQSCGATIEAVPQGTPYPYAD